MDNINPLVIARSDVTRSQKPKWNDLSGAYEPVDALEVFEWLRGLRDPEHPITLEELKVIALDDIHVSEDGTQVDVIFTPTIPTCSQATIIGLMIRAVLQWVLPSQCRVRVRIAEGTHVNEESINKQLADKERVFAALESTQAGLMKAIMNGIRGTRSVKSILRDNISFSDGPVDWDDSLDCSLEFISAAY